MKQYIAAAAVGMALVCALSACGGGGSSPATSQPTVAAAKTHLTIYLDGDSTLWGVDVDDTDNEQQAPGVGNGVVGRANPSPAQLLQADLDKQFGAGVVTVVDGSIPGGTFEHSLQGLLPDVSPLETRLASLSPKADIVLTNSEINDQYVLGENVPTYATWVNQWISTVKSAGAVPVYAEPNPICEAGMNLADPQTGTDALVATADQAFTAAGGTVLPNLAAWENYTAPPNAQPWNVAFMSSDCVHPNEAGYQFKEANYFLALILVIQKLLGH